MIKTKIDELFKEAEAEADALHAKGLKAIKTFGHRMAAAMVLMIISMVLAIAWLVTGDELFNFLSNMTMLAFWLVMLYAADARANMKYNLGYAEGMIANAKFQAKLQDIAKAEPLKDNDTKNDVPKPVSAEGDKSKA